MNIIQKLTQDCTGDCAITNNGGSATCMHWEPVYDKTGKQISGSDPNIYTQYYSCHFCGMSWLVRSRQGQPNEIVPKSKDI